MNPYLSRQEKENYVRVFALTVLLRIIIEEYAKAKSTDKMFLKFLRMGKTFLDKAIRMRNDSLDPWAYKDFVDHSGKMELLFVPKRDAIKHFNEIKQLKSTMPMDAEDFHDWYGEVIDSTCRVCQRSDYEGCKIRGILQKYGVYPIDPAAVGKCQYNYEGAD